MITTFILHTLSNVTYFHADNQTPYLLSQDG